MTGQRDIANDGKQHMVLKSFNPILHSERPKLYTILAFLSAIGLTQIIFKQRFLSEPLGFSCLGL